MDTEEVTETTEEVIEEQVKKVDITPAPTPNVTPNQDFNLKALMDVVRGIPEATANAVRESMSSKTEEVKKIDTPVEDSQTPDKPKTFLDKWFG